MESLDPRHQHRGTPYGVGGTRQAPIMPVTAPPPSASSEAAAAGNPSAVQDIRLVNRLEGAGKAVEDVLQEHDRFPELHDMFTNALYTSMEYSPDSRSVFRLLKMVPFPETLHQMYRSLECKCFMGLFPEINRAWITVDNQLCLWNYETKEYAIWNDQDQIIVSVGLVPPRTNVFSEDVKYVLVLATPVEIVLLAVWFEGNTTQGELHLEPTHITLPADNVNMTMIVGTKNGRIFMAGDDGCLYELYYQTDDGWFSKKARKINHSQGYLTSFVAYLIRDKPSSLIDLVLDESRNILYTLSSRGGIQVYDLGSDGSSITAVSEMQNVISVAERICPRLKQASGKEIVIKSIWAIPKNESKYIHLVAITSAGIRFYFTTFLQNDPATQNPNQRPTTLELSHIRLPPDLSHVYARVIDGTPSTPGRLSMAYETTPTRIPPGRGHAEEAFTPTRRPLLAQPYNVDTSYYSQGVVLMGQPVGENRDEVIAIHEAYDKPGVPQPYDIVYPRPSFLEKATKTEVAGKIWAIGEKPPAVFMSERLRLVPSVLADVDDREGELSLWCDENGQYPSLRNDLAVQHALPPRQFLFLANNALNTMVKIRPVEHVAQVLRQSSGHVTEAMAALDKSYGPVETCAMYLLIAISTSGGSGRSYATLGVDLDTRVAQLATDAFLNHPSAPQRTSTLYHPATGIGEVITNEPPIQFSGRHDGLALLLGRLLKPIWTRPVQQIARINRSELDDLQSRLQALEQFLELHHVAPIPTDLRSGNRAQATDTDDRMDEEEAIPGQSTYTRTGQSTIQGRLSSLFHGKPEEEARKEEQKSMTNLHVLLRRSMETILFLQLLGENRFLGVHQLLPQTLQDRLKRISFSQIITTREGLDLTRALVDALISPYKEGNGDQGSVEAICQRLRTSCPDIFREEDRTRHRADELLHKAKLSRNNREQEELLEQSLQLYRAIAAELTGEKLDKVCESYLYLRFYSGVLRLVLECATAQDPLDRALDWRKEHFTRPVEVEMEEESVGARAYDARQACYRHALNAFAELFYGHHPVFEHIPYEELQHRPPVDTTANNAIALNLLQSALLSKDQLFHETLYQWFLSSHEQPVDHSGRLLEACIRLGSPFIENFLQNTNSRLLPNYYIRKGQYEKAAITCERMANSTDRDLDLEERIDLLSQAKSAAQSAVGNGDLLSRITSNLEVAQVQLKVLQELDAVPLRPVSAEERERRAKGREELRYKGLKGLSTLFNHYIKPSGLWESGLHALKVAHYVDEALTKRFWKSIINEELHKLQTTGFNLDSLRGKIVSLGQSLERDENVFPAEWLCAYLESLMVKDLRQYVPGRDYGWVPRLMLDVGLGMPVLFEIYHVALYEENNPDWAEFASSSGQRPRAKLEVNKAQEWIVAQWLQELQYARDAQRRFLIATIKSSDLEERLAEYIQNLLNQKSEEARRLADAFRDHQALLMRLTYR